MGPADGSPKRVEKGLERQDPRGWSQLTRSRMAGIMRSPLTFQGPGVCTPGLSTFPESWRQPRRAVAMGQFPTSPFSALPGLCDLVKWAEKFNSYLFALNPSLLCFHSMCLW